MRCLFFKAACLSCRDRSDPLGNWKTWNRFQRSSQRAEETELAHLLLGISRALRCAFTIFIGSEFSRMLPQAYLMCCLFLFLRFDKHRLLSWYTSVNMTLILAWMSRLDIFYYFLLRNYGMLFDKRQILHVNHECAALTWQRCKTLLILAQYWSDKQKFNQNLKQLLNHFRKSVCVCLCIILTCSLTFIFV